MAIKIKIPYKDYKYFPAATEVSRRINTISSSLFFFAILIGGIIGDLFSSIIAFIVGFVATIVAWILMSPVIENRELIKAFVNSIKYMNDEEKIVAKNYFLKTKADTETVRQFSTMLIQMGIKYDNKEITTNEYNNFKSLIFKRYHITMRETKVKL